MAAYVVFCVARYSFNCVERVQNFADSRVRIKGRFVKKEEEKIAMLMSVTDEKSTSSTAVSTPASAKRAEAKGRGSKEPVKPVVNQADYDDDEDDDE